MRILIAPDKFKGSLEAIEVAEAIADGLAAVLPTAEVHCQPVADGGEGTVAAALASGYRPVTVSVSGPLGAPIEATFAVDASRAVIEMAAASGLLVLPVGEDGGAPGRTRRDQHRHRRAHRGRAGRRMHRHRPRGRGQRQH